jgi:2-C-methyl-D-erythritol 4-phosphate cytidylyltransferase/2-C-methyl-D-erythritol 2,4-cyclodiphosphate synthase
MIGFGYDIHKLEEGEDLILGGIKITSNKGTIAHSDGDVLIHSIIDALLGAAGLGDIGECFPDTAPQYKNIDSSKLLKIVNQWIENKKLYIVNIDASIVLESPKLSAYKNDIKSNLSNILDIPKSVINIKAKTNEKQDSIGSNNSIVVYSICQLSV